MIGAHHVDLAVVEDAGPIADMSRQLIEYGLPWRWTPRRIGDCIRDAATNVVVAREAGAVAAFAVMKYDDDEAHLQLLAVRESFRRRGLGSALVGWLETTVRVAGIGRVSLEARADNRGARAFYRAHGYREINFGRGYYSGRVDCVRMAKSFWAAPPEA